MQIDSTAAALGRTEFWTPKSEGLGFWHRLWLPPQASTTAHQIDAVFGFILLCSVLLTLFVTAGVLYLIVRYRRRSHADRPVDVAESKLLEVSWMVLPGILVLIVFFWGFKAYIGTSIPPANAYEISVKGQKWFWTFEYPNGKVTQSAVVVPAGEPIKLVLTSQDVLHSFFVPEFRVKHDVVPNRFVTAWFEAPEEGVYQIVCAEYCGTDHSHMGAKIYAVGRQAFYRFLAGQPTGNAALDALGGGGENLPPAQLGEQIYEAKNCNTCHSIDGTPKVGPTWKGIWGEPVPGSAQGVVNDDYIRESILKPQAYIVPGFGGASMPSYDGLLNDRQIEGVAAYIRLLSGAATEADTTLAPAGGEAAGDESAPPADQ